MSAFVHARIRPRFSAQLPGFTLMEDLRKVSNDTSKVSNDTRTAWEHLASEAIMFLTGRIAHLQFTLDQTSR